jgi:hypothetical protein
MPAVDESVVREALSDLTASRITSLRAAEAAYGVSRRTLARRVDGGLSRSKSHAHQQALSPTQEDSLVQWILDLERQGCAPTYTETREMARQISVFSKGPNFIGQKWI